VGAPEHGFDAFSFRSERALDRGRFDRAVNDLPPEVFRAKGFVRLGEGGYLFNYVAGRAELEPHEAAATELVFIGRGIGGVRDAILAGLRDAEA
jgi:G3E family GTPase